MNTPSFPPLLASPKCQLIVCQMSSTRCPTLNWLLLPLFLIVATVIVGAVSSHVESVLLCALTAAFTLAHIHYGVQVVSGGSSAEQDHSCLLLGTQRAQGEVQRRIEGRSGEVQWRIASVSLEMWRVVKCGFRDCLLVIVLSQLQMVFKWVIMGNSYSKLLYGFLIEKTLF